MTRFDVWAQNKSSTYISCPLCAEDAAAYLVNRTGEIASASQVQFDKLIHDAMTILRQDILIDFFGKNNFFYDAEAKIQQALEQLRLFA